MIKPTPEHYYLCDDPEVGKVVMVCLPNHTLYYHTNVKPDFEGVPFYSDSDFEVLNDLGFLTTKEVLIKDKDAILELAKEIPSCEIANKFDCSLTTMNRFISDYHEGGAKAIRNAYIKESLEKEFPDRRLYTLREVELYVVADKLGMSTSGLFKHIKNKYR